MKPFVLPALFLLPFSLSAADRIVEEFGLAPAYPNITAAVAAAVDGDRIIVKNRAGNIPWIENITVDKSLQFLSFANDDFFVVQGTYTIPFASGRQVTIIGMRNTSGSIVSSGSGALRSTRVRIIDSELVNGGITFNNDGFDADVVGCTIMAGGVRINFGNVVGNEIVNPNSSEGIRVTPTSTVFQGDTCAIIGNKVQSILSWEGIFVNGRAQVYHVRNNWVRHGWMGIEIQGGNTAGVPNLIWNNSITAYTGQFTVYGISIANTTAGSVWEVMNNAVGHTWTGSTRGINRDSGNDGQINVYYNHVHSGTGIPISVGFTFEGNNTTNQQVTFNANGTLANAPGAIDGANPAAPFYDLDLSTGDAGAYGGSYTLDNFHPLHSGAARVYMTGHPFNVRSGNSLRVKAIAFDR